MTKLTVSEASKRGYATGLSILQAVQKNWLTAEKGADGQLLVDIADLERIFGAPSGSGAAAMPSVGQPVAKSSTPVAPGLMERAGRTLDDNGEPHRPAGELDDGDEDVDDWPYATAADGAVMPESRAANDAWRPSFGPSPAPAAIARIEQSSDTGLPDTMHPPADFDAHAAVRDEIERLRAELATEKRRVAALLDVLANRILPSPAASEPAAGEPVERESAGSESAGSESIRSESAESRPAETRVSTRDDMTAGDGTTSSRADNGRDDSHAAAAPIEAAEPPTGPGPDADPVSAAPPFSVASDDSLPELPADGARDRSVAALSSDDISVPAFSAGPRTVLTATPQLRMAADRSRAGVSDRPEFFWRLWWLMSLVWFGLIGAFFWFVFDLQADLAVIGQWIRGSLAADTPEMVAATKAVARAARDTLGPPAALLIVMLVVRLLVRLLRR